ncbi:MAG: tRNA (adenosine(37)-N6)-threonylcarbamoyltransferase complex ATPase subunit type 1 TsaE [Saprospiraceae bacterium]
MKEQDYIFGLDQLDEISKKLLDQILPYQIIGLQAEMGVGKTTLVRAIGKHLGFESETGSPTFSIINEYHCKPNPWAIQKLYHMDLYRLKNLEEALNLGIHDYFDSGIHCIIEWPELIEPILASENYLRVQIERLENQQRKIIVTL